MCDSRSKERGVEPDARGIPVDDISVESGLKVLSVLTQKGIPVFLKEHIKEDVENNKIRESSQKLGKTQFTKITIFYSQLK